MPGISAEALAGYVLEELLAHLLSRAGYRLLTDASQDPHELSNQHHGLVIHGRGADHQVDVLGELLWIPAFTYPLRLVLEAKCRKGRTDIGTVRGMVAALLDINQNNMPNRLMTGASKSVPPRPKYAYVGAIFSASGFSAPAADFALAHAISLVDLRAPDFAAIVAAARECGIALSETYLTVPKRSASGFVRAVRDRLRSLLGTATWDQPSLLPEAEFIKQWQVDPALQIARETGELFIGMASGPYMLVLKADNPRDFLRAAAEAPTHRVGIHWSSRHDDGQTWSITPVDGVPAYRLSFKLPERLSDWILGSENARQTALAAKEAFLSSITIYRKDPRKDQLIRLLYDPTRVREALP